MINNYFGFLKGIGYNIQNRLYEQNICTWNEFLDSNIIKGISNIRKRYYDKQILLAKKNLNSSNSAHFKDIPAKEMWRVYDYFSDEAVFLDIETTGVSKNAKPVMVGLYDGFDTKTMFDRINLDFSTHISKIIKNKINNFFSPILT